MNTILLQVSCTAASGLARLGEIRRERGAAMVEYSLLVALIAVVVIAAIGVFGQQVSSDFSGINSDIEAGLTP